MLGHAFRHYFDFKGRASRGEWGLVALIFYPLQLVLMFAHTMVSGEPGPAVALLMALMVPIALMLLSCGVRRLHDTGRSGWWHLLLVIPFVGWLALIIMKCLPSEKAPNQWGDELEEGYWRE